METYVKREGSKTQDMRASDSSWDLIGRFSALAPRGSYQELGRGVLRSMDSTGACRVVLFSNQEALRAVQGL